MHALRLENARREFLRAHRGRVGCVRAATPEGTRAKRLSLRIGASSCKDGRFLQVDPIIANAANSQALNPYSYIGNNPLSGKDPTGYRSQCESQDLLCKAGPYGVDVNAPQTIQQLGGKNGSQSQTPTIAPLTAAQYSQVSTIADNLAGPGESGRRDSNGNKEGLSPTLTVTPDRVSSPSDLAARAYQQFANMRVQQTMDRDSQTILGFTPLGSPVAAVKGYQEGNNWKMGLGIVGTAGMALPGVTTFRGAFTAASAIRGATTAAEAMNGFSAAEQVILAEARGILNSSQLAQLRAAYSAGQSITVNIGGRVVQYEPQLAASGMTMFGENGFLLGREAFSSTTELQKTVLHELYRLGTTSSASGLSGSMATQETQAAFNFAERASQALNQ